MSVQSRARSSYAEPQPTLALASRMQVQRYKICLKFAIGFYEKSSQFSKNRVKKPTQHIIIYCVGKLKIVGEIGVGVHIGLKGQQLLAQGSALGCMMQEEARPVRAKAFALTARKKQHLHKNPGRCPGLLAAAPLGRRWVLVVGGCCSGRLPPPAPPSRARLCRFRSAAEKEFFIN